MTPRLIHGDLNPWNIKIKGEEIVFFDFEEAKLAFPLHDIAVFLYYYRHHETLNYQEVKKAFLEGYTQFRPMPKNLDDKNLDLVMISRRINFFNYVLTIRKDPSEYIAMSFPIIKEYYLSYK